MEPIINPWIAYLAYLSSSIHMLFKVLLCASVVILIIGFLCEFEFINHEKVDKFIKNICHHYKYLGNRIDICSR